MKASDKLKENVQELIERYIELKKENTQLEEKIQRIEKDLSFHVDRNQELPEVILRNKKLLSDREKITDRIDGILKNLEAVKV